MGITKMNNEEFIARIADKQDVMAEDINEIKISIITHIKRTNILEDLVHLNKEQNTALFEKLDKDLAPIKSHVTMLNAGLKIVGGLSVVVGILAGIVKIIQFLT
jgi:cobalamin biosynthesis Mg chelatase CobN